MKNRWLGQWDILGTILVTNLRVNIMSIFAEEMPKTQILGETARAPIIFSSWPFVETKQTSKQPKWNSSQLISIQTQGNIFKYTIFPEKNAEESNCAKTGPRIFLKICQYVVYDVFEPHNKLYDDWNILTLEIF